MTEFSATESESGLTGAKLVSITPQFLVLDLQAACAFYVEKLGFRVAFTYGGFYAGVERDGMTIHLKLSDEPDLSRQAKQRDEHLDVYITVDDVASLYAEYQRRDVMFAQPLDTKPWGMREFVVWDNSGFILHFGQGA
jgi:catechol 2,3-dioxygenase-like lactoylglutathione lyase family enzyme